MATRAMSAARRRGRFGFVLMRERRSLVVASPADLAPDAQDGA